MTVNEYAAESSDATAHTEQPIRKIERDGVNYTLLGTAHVSRASVDAVNEMIREGGFDAVAVELCESRYDSLTNPDAWHKMDLFKVIREGKAGLLAANLALGSYQRRLADQFGIEPGAEMKAALDRAKEQNLPHLLIDRDISITLKRVFRKVGFLERISLLGGIVFSMFSREEITEADIEKLKQGDVLESTFAEFAEQSEPLYDVLIAERDQFMAARLRQEALQNTHANVLAVVGAGHLEGFARHLADDKQDPDDQVVELNTLPPKRAWVKWVPWIITALVLAGFAYGFSQNTDLGWETVKIWILFNGALAAIGALLAGAHPLTILIAFVAAPLTSLNPTIAAGMVTASMEAWLRKPRVEDFAAMRDDLLKTSGWWRNKVARILLIFVLSNLGSIAGTWIAGFKIFSIVT